MVSQGHKTTAEQVASRLRTNLDTFAKLRLGERLAVDQVVADVEKFAAWLSYSIPPVSSGVSDDGLLSLAAVCDDDVRLYIEISLDGTVEAVVSKSLTHAKQIDVTTIGDLTPELVIGAIQGSP